jgi:hypothetical protein
MIRKPNEQGSITPGWVNPYYQDKDRIRPTELLLNNPYSNQLTKLQYCTNNQDQSVTLQAAAGDTKYNCVDATVIVRSFYETGVDKFPQNAKIGVYQERDSDLLFHGWLLLDESHYMVTTKDYNAANNYSLTGGPGEIHISNQPLQRL